jgi:hypothetical protein
MSHWCRARAETPLGAIALDTPTPPPERWTSLLLKLLLLALWLCSSAPTGPWLTPELAGPCLWLQDQRARTHPADATTYAKLPLGQRAPACPGRRVGGSLRKPPRRPCRTAPTPRPGPASSRAARRPARWRLALCRGGPGLRRRSQRRRLRPRTLRHCARARERRTDLTAHPDLQPASLWVSDICRTGFPPHPGPPRKRVTPDTLSTTPLSPSSQPTSSPPRARPRLGTPPAASQGSPAEPPSSAAARRSERRFTLRLMVDGTAQFARPLVLQDCDQPAPAEVSQSSQDAQATQQAVSREPRAQGWCAGASEASDHDAGARGRASLCASSPSSHTQETTQPPVTRVPSQPDGFYDFTSRLPAAPQLVPCPVAGCAERFEKMPSLSAHLRRAHTGVQLDSESEQRLGIARCPVCVVYYRSGSLSQHQCRPARRPARPLTASLAAQLARNPTQVAAVPLPLAPPELDWPVGAPAGDRCWFLVPLIASLLAHGPDVHGGLAGFYAQAKWQRWREHFSAELGARPPPIELPTPTPTTEEACVEFLRGPTFACPVSDSCADPPPRGLLQLVDHINLRHHNEEWEADLPDVKRCVCGYLYLDTAVGKACHMRWCERLSLAL